MSSRISDDNLPRRRFGLRRGAAAWVALLLLAACNRGDGGKIEGAEPLECMIPGQSGFKEVCTIEHNETPDGTVFTARSPDGGFHRFMPVGDDRHIVAADGAEEVKVAKHGDGFDVTADDITYRIMAADIEVAVPLQSEHE